MDGTEGQVWRLQHWVLERGWQITGFRPDLTRHLFRHVSGANDGSYVKKFFFSLMFWFILRERE